MSRATNLEHIEFSPKDYAMKLVDKASAIDVSEVRKSITVAGGKIATYLSDLQVYTIVLITFNGTQIEQVQQSCLTSINCKF